MKILFRKKNYLLPHKNTNWAFVDGILCGVVVASTVITLLQDYNAIKDYERSFKEPKEDLSFDEPTKLNFN